MSGPELSRSAKASLAALSQTDRELFDLRLARSWPDFYEPFERLYRNHPDFVRITEKIVHSLAEGWASRPADLKRLDLKRDLNPDWFLRPKHVGYVFYIDRFAGKLTDVLKHLDYLEDLGVTYVHFMPCLKPRGGDNDGGYSVQDYRAINPKYGTMKDFAKVTAALRARGMSVCLDMVLNHTARDHEWAIAAREGNKAYRDYYHLYPDRQLPNQFEKTLVEVFPDQAPGNFTYDAMSKSWVWTTFNTHQWDLNWGNPAVMLEIIDIMLYLANQGAEVLRLDAVAFMWKRLGTTCQNQPEVHDILQALRAACRISATGVLHKAEAIVSPDQLLPYLGTGQHTGKVANLAYHNSLMVQYWGALATRDTGLMRHVLRNHFPAKHVNATWGTYLRCHDDIGWAITDEDAGALGMSGPAHRDFLAEFYRGNHPGSFARGGLFQYNPATNDKRSNGTMASLAGLQAGIEQEDEGRIQDAIKRILMGHALIASFGGIPLIYMGDEIGLLNDAQWSDHSNGENDSRWMHRPMMDWDIAHSVDGPAAQLRDGIRHILQKRKYVAHFHSAVPRAIPDTPDTALFAVRRQASDGQALCLFNFSERDVFVPNDWLAAQGIDHPFDILQQSGFKPDHNGLTLPGYGVVWLT